MDVQAQYVSACDRVARHLFARLRDFVVLYRRDNARTPEHVVLLAGTAVAAALAATTRQALGAWDYDPNTGLMSIGISRVRVVVCEDPDLGADRYRMLAAGAAQLGSPITRMNMVPCCPGMPVQAAL